MRVLFLFLGQGCVGCFLLLYLMPRQAGANFFSMMAGKILAPVIALNLYIGWAARSELVGASPVLLNAEMLLLALFFICLLVYALGVHVDKPLLSVPSLLVGTLAGVAHIVVTTLVQAQLAGSGDLLSLPILMSRFLNGMAGGLLLGAATVGMILGHWYLVAPGLPMEPLRRANQFLLWLVLVNGLVTALSVAVASGTGRSIGTALRVGDQDYSLFIWARVLMGLVGTFVAWAITWFIVREATRFERTGRLDRKGHSVQGATGFLYVAMLTVLVGELCRCVLTTSTSGPF